MIHRNDVMLIIDTRIAELRTLYENNTNKFFDWVEKNRRETSRDGVWIFEHEGVICGMNWMDIIEAQFTLKPFNNQQFAGYAPGESKLIIL